MVRKRPWWLVPLAAVLAAAAIAFVLWRHLAPIRAARTPVPAALQSVLWPEARAIAAFHLSTQTGAEFGQQQFRGQWNFVFFGYLSCPDVCPTTLLTLADLRRRLLAADPAAARYRFVFVSVDPAQDTVERMAGYIGYFDRSFLGLTGDASELARLARSLGAAYAERVDEHGVRTFEHSSSVLLVDPAGRAVGSFAAPHDPARMMAMFQDIRRHLGD